MSERAQGRTEAPSARRRREARRAGRVAWSPLLTAAAALAALWLALRWVGEALLAGLAGGLRAWLSEGASVAPGELGAVALGLATRVAGPVLQLLVVVLVAAGAAALVQVGPLFTPRVLAPDWGRLGLAAGWRRLWSLEARLARWRAGLAAVAVLAPAALVVAGSLRELVALPYHEPRAGLVVLSALADRWLVASVAGLGALGLLDLLWQRRRLDESLRMTRREAELERRETEGDPLFRRERQRLLWAEHHAGLGGSGRRMSKAAVVVASSAQGVAVAMYYEPARGDAPEVLAKGVGRTGVELRQRAVRLGLRVVEEPALAQALANLAVGESVPEALWGEVARVLRERESE
jgi:flagellar biosynthesis protein FlhB